MDIVGVAEEWHEIEPGTYLPSELHGARPGTLVALCGRPADDLHPMPYHWGISHFPGVTDRGCAECLRVLESSR